jgi:hypothetical protein
LSNALIHLVSELIRSQLTMAIANASELVAELTTMKRIFK